MLKTKSRFHLSWRQNLALVGLGVLIMVSRLGHVPAQTVIQGFAADSNLDYGTFASVDANNSGKVEATTSDNLNRLRGVVVDPKEATVALSAPNQKVFITTTGRFNVLVSNQNGTIKPNDYISISSLPGIGMKASLEQAIVLGRAAIGFDGKTSVIRTESVKNGNSSKSVAIGKIEVDIGVIRNPQAANGSAGLPGFLQNASSAIVGKKVSLAKAYLAAGLLLICGVITGSLLYAGVRSSIVAIGRNPLSKNSIISGLIQVVVTSLIIFIGGLFGVYLLLKL